MRLIDIESKELLPDFSKTESWCQNAFDVVVKEATNRAKSIDAPLTKESISKLTDEELQALYEMYGIAKYYPDLSRDTRELMLYNMSRLYRYLGTPRSVEVLCQYIFDTVDLSVLLTDNLAYDSEGNLVNPEAFDQFDLYVQPALNTLPPDAADRIMENIFRFSRNSQTLRDFWFILPDNDIEQPACMARMDDEISAVINVENDIILSR